MKRLALPILALLAPAPWRPAAEAAVKLTFEDMLAYVTDLDRLPVIEPGVSCRQFSSYDRASRYDEATGKYINWEANGDSGKFIKIKSDGEAVMADMKGPGCIFRIWSANPQGIIRFYLDGDTQPTYEWDFHKLCAGEFEPFKPPFVWKRDPRNVQSASNIYLPIPFNKSCRVTGIVEKNGKTDSPHHYYIIDYRTFPQDWEVETFRLPLLEKEYKAMLAAGKKWSAGDQLAADTSGERLTQALRVEPGQAAAATALEGPAVIRCLRAKLNSKELWATRKVMLRVFWDGEAKPSISAPIGDFFGEPKSVNYASYAMGILDEYSYCNFSMPFHKSARIEFRNDGDRPVEITLDVSYAKRDVPENWGLFKAKWRNELASRTFDYPLVEATGTGKFVGTALFPDNIAGGWWGEGDEKVYVDGEKFPSWFGTGSEDYFGDAWGIQHFVNPSHGHPQKAVERMQGCYRWHFGDSIPFYKSFRMTIENYAYAGVGDSKQRNDYASVAYWYQLPGGSDFFTDTPVEDRIPRGFVAAGAIEAEKCVDKNKLAAGAAVLSDKQFPQPLSNDHGVKLTGKVGTEFTFNIPADADQVYSLRLIAARDVPASSYDLVANGQSARKRVSLRAGPNAVTVRLTGNPISGDTCELVVDYFTLDVYRNMITQWMVIGPFANMERKGLSVAFPPEQEIALDKKYKGRDNEEAAWKKFERPDGIIMLNNRFDPRENLVLYGACVVSSPDDRRETMMVGSDDGVKIWINGKPVWENKADRPLRADDDRFPLELKKGENSLLIKVEQGSGDVGFAVRFLDPKDELTFSIPK